MRAKTFTLLTLGALLMLAPASAQAVDFQVSKFKATVVGTTVTYSATVCNKGSTTTKSFDIELYYHRTTAPTCSTLPSQQWIISGGLAYNKCVTKSYVRKNVTSGGYTAWLAADADCKVKETNENNNKASYKYAVSGTTLKPDLYIHSFTASVSGTTVTYKVTACNQGAATSTTFDVELYYHRTLAPGCSTTQNKTWTISGLGAFKCVNRTHVRTGVTNGSYTGWARADADCKVSESSENNNNKAYKYSVVALPDLYVSTFYALSSGSTVTYYTTVCNKGESTTKSFDIELYYNRTYAPGCSTVASYQWSQAGLAAGKCVIKTYKRSNVKAGTYMGWARVDADCKLSESNENNNNKYDGYTVGSTKPDLYVQSFGATTSGTSVTYKVVACNKGASTKTSFDIEVYYHRTTAPGCTTYLSYQWFITGGLAAGKCVTKSYVRKGVPSGAYMGWARVDADCKVAESYEYNNNASALYKVGTLKPDLYVSTFTTSVSGSTVTYKAIACNKGSTTAKSFDLEIYFNRTSAPGCTTTSSTEWTIAGLAAKACVTKSYVRKGTPNGSYIGWARVDADCAVSEILESNNNKSSKYTVSSQKPDLHVKSFKSAVAGQDVTFTAEVCNKGATITKTFDVGLSYHLGAKPGCSTKGDFKWSVKGLVAGKCSTLKHTRKSTPNGSYVGWVLADSGCSVSESDETNNSYASVYMVALQPDTGVVLPDSGPQPDMPPPPPPDQFIQPDQPQPEEDGPPPVEPDGEAAAPDQGTPDQAVTTPDQGGTGEGGEDEGCSCQMQRLPHSGNGALLLLGLGLLLALRRRRE